MSHLEELARRLLQVRQSRRYTCGDMDGRSASRCGRTPGLLARSLPALAYIVFACEWLAARMFEGTHGRACEQEGRTAVGFGVTEYTVVFRRALRQRTGQRTSRAVWTVVRPFTRPGMDDLAALTDERADVAQVFVVPICSTLALDTAAYEKFLVQSGALNRALRALNGLTFAQPQTAENARKQIQSIVMAAEVNLIVRKMSA